MASIIEVIEDRAELRAAPPGPVSRIETEGEGGDFATRALASIKMTPEGRAGFLESVFGKRNVVTSSNGEIFVRQTPEGPFVPFDERGFSFKDITADLLGIGIEIAPAIAAGTNPLTVAGAGAAGNIVRQGASALLPGEDDLSLLERGASVATSAVLQGGIQKGVNVGAKVVDALRPSNLVARQALKAAKTTFAKKGERLSTQTGIPLSFGERTGNRSALMVEGIARQTLGAADEFFGFHQKQLRESVGRLKQILDTITPKSAGSFETGRAVIKAYDDAVESAHTIRKNEAGADFGEVNRLAGNEKIIGVDNLVAEIDRVIKELDVPGAGDAAASLINKAKRLKDGLLVSRTKDPAGTISSTGLRARANTLNDLTADQTQRILQIYTAAQRGTGVLFKDIDKAQGRLIAARLKNALLRDLDEAAEISLAGEEVVTALLRARGNYKANSEAINELADSTLSRLIGNRTTSSEAIAEKIVTKLQPSEVKSVMTILETANPQAASSVRRFMVETAMANARPPVTQGTAQGVKFSAARFVSSLPDTKILRAANFSREQVRDILRVTKVLERVADRALEGSPTAARHLVWDTIKGVFTLNPVTLGRAAGAVLAPRAIAKAVLTPEGRASLVILSSTGAPTKKALAALASLTALNIAEPSPENVRPIP